jgi:hypothetical protein
MRPGSRKSNIKRFPSQAVSAVDQREPSDHHRRSACAGDATEPHVSASNFGCELE